MSATEFDMPIKFYSQQYTKNYSQLISIVPNEHNVNCLSHDNSHSFILSPLLVADGQFEFVKAHSIFFSAIETLCDVIANMIIIQKRHNERKRKADI